MEPIKTLAAQFLAMSERSPALEMREDFSVEFLAELYKVPVESVTTPDAETLSPAEFGADSFVPIRISGDMALEFKALCVTASQTLGYSADPVGRWWIELRRHFPTNSSVRNENNGCTVTNAAFWSSQLCDILSDPSGEPVSSRFHAPGRGVQPVDFAPTPWRHGINDSEIVAQARNWRDDPAKMLKDLGDLLDRVQESITFDETSGKIFPPYDPDTLSHFGLRADTQRASESLQIVDPTSIALRELARSFAELRIEISGTEALPSGVMESLFSRIVGGLREIRLLQDASECRKTPRQPVPSSSPPKLYTAPLPKAFLCNVLDDVSDKTLQGQIELYGIRIHPDDKLRTRKQKIRLEIESLSNTRLYKDAERASLLLSWQEATKNKGKRKKKTD